MFTLGVFSLSYSTTLQARLSLLRLNHGNDQQLLLKKNASRGELTSLPTPSLHANSNPHAGANSQQTQRPNQHKNSTIESQIGIRTREETVVMQRKDHRSSRGGRSRDTATSRHINECLETGAQIWAKEELVHASQFTSMWSHHLPL